MARGSESEWWFLPPAVLVLLPAGLIVAAPRDNWGSALGFVAVALLSLPFSAASYLYILSVLYRRRPLKLTSVPGVLSVASGLLSLAMLAFGLVEGVTELGAAAASGDSGLVRSLAFLAILGLLGLLVTIRTWIPGNL